MSVDFQSEEQKILANVEDEINTPTLIEDRLEMDTQDFINNTPRVQSDADELFDRGDVHIKVSSLSNTKKDSIIIQATSEIPPPHISNHILKPCPYCFRNFSLTAADRHIPVCKNTKNRPKPPPTRYDVYEMAVFRQDQIKKVETTLKNTSRNESQKQSSKMVLKSSLELQKIKQTKDNVAELVSSDMLKELQKERESPFLRRESNRADKSF
jgi:hypothetical protein